MTAVAYIVFNRPQCTEQTFGVLREQRPSELFIIADGPRPGSSTDIERCAKVREIVGQIDWPCTVHRRYAASNLGLKKNVSSGLDWVFSKVDRAIILEDDCLPHPDFFRFCGDLLERFENDKRVWVVTGNNFNRSNQRANASYYFSKYNHCWGWATWRRAWQHYRGDLPFWPEWGESKDWREKCPDPVERRYWDRIFEQVRAEQIDSWAYPWTASVWYHGGLTATPNVNLVSNIGFGADSTHTDSEDSALAALATRPIGEISHPSEITQDLIADRFVFDHSFGGLGLRLPYSLFRLPRRAVGLLYRFVKQYCAR